MEGDDERGVDISELAVLKFVNAIWRFGEGRCGPEKKEGFTLELGVGLQFLELDGVLDGLMLAKVCWLELGVQQVCLLLVVRMVRPDVKVVPVILLENGPEADEQGSGQSRWLWYGRQRWPVPVSWLLPVVIALLLFVPINLVVAAECCRRRRLVMMIERGGASGLLNIELRGRLNTHVRVCPAMKPIAIGWKCCNRQLWQGVWWEVSLQFHAYGPSTF